MISPETFISTPVRFVQRGSGQMNMYQPFEDFQTSLPEFSPVAQDTVFHQLFELHQQGYQPILHVVFHGTLTGLSLADSIPANVKEFYEQLHVVSETDIASFHPKHKNYIVQHPESLVVIDQDGSLSEQMQKRLKGALQNRMGIIIGGGPGHPDEAFYRPVLKALEQPIKHGTPIAGICLGNEMIGHILASIGKGDGIHGEYYELGSQVEHITADGKKHAIFQDFSGERVVVVHVNKYH